MKSLVSNSVFRVFSQVFLVWTIISFFFFVGLLGFGAIHISARIVDYSISIWVMGISQAVVALVLLYSFHRIQYGHFISITLNLLVARLLPFLVQSAFPEAFPAPPSWDESNQAFISSPNAIYNFFPNYIMVGAITYVVYFYEAFRQKALMSLQLEKALGEAKLAALQSQIHPHFLFNTLHSINDLMESNVPEAQKMVVRLSELLRKALALQEQHFISLGEELDFIDKYLAIELMRFADKLTVEKDINKEVFNSEIPTLLLQPLIENAIKHGISQLTSDGFIYIKAYKKNNQLVLQVIDNGPGFSNNKASNSGIGLKNIENRLRFLYNEMHLISITCCPYEYNMVEIKIPFKEYHSNQITIH